MKEQEYFLVIVLIYLSLGVLSFIFWVVYGIRINKNPSPTRKNVIRRNNVNWKKVNLYISQGKYLRCVFQFAVCVTYYFLFYKSNIVGRADTAFMTITGGVIFYNDIIIELLKIFF